MDLATLSAAALALDPRSRAALAHQLIESLDQLTPAENESLWAEVAGDRLAELRAGKLEAIPGDQVLAEGRALLG